MDSTNQTNGSFQNYQESETQDIYESDTSNNPIAGLFRSVIRTSFQRLIPSTIGKSSIGSIPRIKHQTIVKSVNQLSDLMDVREVINTSSPHFKQQNYKLFITKTLIEFMKNSILGSTLFGVYESSSSFMSQLQYDSFYSSMIPIASGAFGGLAHAIVSYNLTNLSIRIDKSLHRNPWISSSPQTIPSVNIMSFRGLILSHILVHASLFGSYEFSKKLLLSTSKPPLLSHDTKSYQLFCEHMVLVFSCGYFSGLVSELIAHYTSKFEVLTINPLWKVILYEKTPAPRIKYLLMTSVSSAIGFLAYETSNWMIQES